MQNERIDDRFTAALSYLCKRWECSEFQRTDSEGTLVPGPWRWEYAPDHPIQALRHNLRVSGGVLAARRLLPSQIMAEFNLDLLAHRRLDLTLDALCLRPAWRKLFDVEEQRTAAKRLSDAIAFASSGMLVAPSGADLESTIDWLNEQTIRWEHDSSLPRSITSYPNDSLDDAAGGAEPDWCDSVARTARELEEIGCIRTSLKQCIHYRGCPACVARWPQLERFVREFEEKTVSSCRQVLNLLTKCLNRVQEEWSGRGTGDEIDALAWRAIICAAGAAERSDVWEVHTLLKNWPAGEKHGDAVLRELLGSLTVDEVFALHLSDTTSHLFFETQWFLYERNDLIHLPTDGDLADIPDILDALPCPDFSQWRQLMTGSDLGFKHVHADGDSIEIPMRGDALLQILAWAAENRASGSNTVPAAAQLVSRIDSARATSKRIGLPADSVASNSAQTLMVDDADPFGASRYRAAEESLHDLLGDQIFYSLCPGARTAAISAEYCWLDVQFPAPDNIVCLFATAFERQLRDELLYRFCEHLKASGVRNYPELDGPAPVTISRSTLPTRPAPGRPADPPARLPAEGPLPRLLISGWQSDRLTLGAMACLLRRPLPAMLDFLAASGLSAERLAEVAKEVAKRRNPALHQGGLSREEASDIRRDWLGLEDPGSNIFSALIPASRKAGGPDSGSC